MNLILIALSLLNLLNIIMIYSISINTQLRNTQLRFIVFKEKRIGKIIKGLKNEFKYLSQLYYNKAMACTAKGINNFNELSEEEKLIIETILSLCY